MIIRTITLLIFLSVVLTGCSSITASQTPTPDYSLYVLDPVFREFYSLLGGREVLGDVISEMKEINGAKNQYVVGGLLVFDSTAAENRRFQFGNLAQEFGIIEAPDADKGVADPFKEIYKRLGGSVFVGKPLTGLVYNTEKKRYEQYFENLGFYMGQETEGEVRLLPYGVWKCGDDCQRPGTLNALPELPRPTLSSYTVSPVMASPVTPEIATETAEAPGQAPQATSESTQPSPPSQAAREPVQWSLMVWENAPSVTTGQSQGIGVYVFRNDIPTEGVALDLVLTLPDGTQQKFSFPPTDSDGFSRIRLPAIQAPSGTVVAYEVCLTNPSGERYCVKQSFQIWGR